MTFTLSAFRFHLAAREPISFPHNKAGNTLRGWFGETLRLASPAAHGKIFAPVSAGGSPSGLADPPRPFVFRASHLDGQALDAGDDFWIGVNLFGDRADLLPAFEAAFARTRDEGLGPRRGRAELLGFEQVDADGRASTSPISIPLTRGDIAASELRVGFRTPTELKSGGGLASQPDFGILFARARDRISSLRALNGEGPLAIDFRAMGERAAAVRTTRSDLQHVEVRRRSSRSGQTHSIGGFIGQVEYEGDLAEFVPYLEAARWTGVGRHCVWGNGEIAPQVVAADITQPYQATSIT